MSIVISNLTKRFGSFTALDNINLEIPNGELVALLGPSGSGKTTLLRIIAGLEFAESGQVAFDGNDATNTTPQNRHVGFVFQHYALFRHMSVLDNVTFGLSVKPRHLRPSREAAVAKAHELLQLVQLDGFAHRLPTQLSGGQRQRVALARALAIEPKVLLLDEPFGALDAQVRKELRRWLRRLHDEVHVTSVFVTHDQEEALEVADRIVVFNRGRIEQIGKPDHVYHHPATPFVHNFLGSVNVFHGRQVGAEQAQTGDLIVKRQSKGNDENVSFFVRPHDIEIARQRDSVCLLPAKIIAVAAAGPLVRVILQRSDEQRQTEAEISHERQQSLHLQEGESVFIGFSRFEVYDGNSLTNNDYQI
jgi:sulfate transport system ATP-binding protein